MTFSAFSERITSCEKENIAFYSRYQNDNFDWTGSIGEYLINDIDYRRLRVGLRRVIG